MQGTIEVISQRRLSTLTRIAVSALAFASLGLLHVAGALADQPEPSAYPAERTHLLGDWGGARTQLMQRGIIVDIQGTQFYQGVVEGSAGTDDWQYGTKADVFFTLVGEKLGLWKGFVVNAHLEGRFGEDVNTSSGLSPANTAMLMPSSDDTVALTQLMGIQFLSPEIAITGGKYNAFDFVDMAFHTGRGVDGFMNVSMAMPIGLGRTVPLGILGAGVLSMKGKEVQGALLAYDPNDCATTSCLEHAFEDAGVVAVWKFFTGIGPDGPNSGYVSIGGTYSGKQYTVVDPQNIAIIPGQGLVFTETDPSWAIFSVVNQQLWADPLNPSRALTFKGMYSITDGKANPIKWSATAALEMSGPISERDKDVLGVGYFHTQLSSGFKDTVGLLLPLDIKDTDGFEAYYKAQVTPWLAVTGDVQVITKTLSNEDTKVVTGVRAKVTF